MAKIEVAVMEPKYQQNLGYIARVSRNFGVERLILINPRCDHVGKQAIKYSKHASMLLKNASVLKDIKRLNCDLLIGTTGIWHKSNQSFYNVYNPRQMAKLSRSASRAGKKVVLMLGRDDTGLTKGELAKCDAQIFIGANKDYPILNISHALAIMLYELTYDSMSENYALDSLHADSAYQERMTALFDRLVKKSNNIRDKAAVSAAFRRMVRRSIPTKKEINAVSAALSPKNQEKKRRD